MQKPLIAGVAMTRFHTPRSSPPYTALAEQAARNALADAGLDYVDVGAVYAGYVYGDSACGQRAVYAVGLTGVPVVNVNNNCATGSSALFLARQAVAAGADCVLALGFEQMRPGAIVEVFEDRPSPLQPFLEVADRRFGESEAPIALRLFGAAAREYAQTYGADPALFAGIAVKARRHAGQNPNAVFVDPITLEEVMASPMLFDPLTRLQCCPPTCGAAAALVVSPAFARRRGLTGLVEIAGQAMRTDGPDSFAGSAIAAVGAGMGRAAAEAAYAEAGLGPEDLSVVELHDCFTINEIIAYEALGLAPDGGAAKLAADGDNTYGGRFVVNPSGGLLSKGHPLGATGLAQCYELTQHLRGAAGARQVEGARTALQHNVGLGGACVVTVYRGA